MARRTLTDSNPPAGGSWLGGFFVSTAQAAIGHTIQRSTPFPTWMGRGCGTFAGEQSWLATEVPKALTREHADSRQGRELAEDVKAPGPSVPS